jgi:hypothetical protein
LDRKTPTPLELASFDWLVQSGVQIEHQNVVGLNPEKMMLQEETDDGPGLVSA